MKWIAFFLSIMLCGLFAPVTPRAAAAVMVPAVSATFPHVRVEIAAVPTQTLTISQVAVCGVQTDTVGEWLSQSVCESVALEVTQADTAGIQLAVTDMPVVAQLAVQRTPATVQTAHVQPGNVPVRTTMDSPVPLVVQSPRSHVQGMRVATVSVVATPQAYTAPTALYSLRC